MFKNIAFIGGIHGVGKSSICKIICNEIDITYLSASDVLKWKEVTNDSIVKNVANIPSTQDRLLEGLKNTINGQTNYLLDGHYCLLNLNNEIVEVPFETFKEINPISLNLIIGNVADIKLHLEQRDNKQYDLELLKKMQDSEINYAKYLSKKLNVSLNIGKRNDFKSILNSLKNTSTR